MSNGQGCTCNAWSENECACGADWTPQEVYDLRAENDRLKAELAEAKKDAERYQFLLLKGLQRAWVSLSTDCDGENFAQFQCTFNVPEPPNLPYEDDEGLQWADKDFDAAIDLAIKAMKGK